MTQGVSLAVADGVGGWVESGIDPALFSQSLMYHAHCAAQASWAGEPESDPTVDSMVDGVELTPVNCLNVAYRGVMKDQLVVAGEYLQHAK
jgi:protein phosphatase PTC7